MTKTISPVSFFFGVAEKNGYCSLFDTLYDPFEKGTHLILKGGPGTGKSTLMKKIAEKLENDGLYVERGYCSADPQSLDVVLSRDINFSVFDGTAPHTFDPTLPGVSEHIVDLSVAWDRKFLGGHIGQIAELSLENKHHHKKAVDFLKAASQIATQSAVICNSFTDEEKVQRYARRLASRLVPSRKGVQKGKFNKRFLSAITPEGVAVEYGTVTALCENTVAIEDEHGAVAPYIVRFLCDYAVENGYDVYACFCPTFPKFKAEHVIIPELKTCLFTENSYHPAPEDISVRVHASRFYDKTSFSDNKNKLAFTKKAEKELTDEAVRQLSLAKDTHDRLEEYYIKATDFDIINSISEKILYSLT